MRRRRRLMGGRRRVRRRKYGGSKFTDFFKGVYHKVIKPAHEFAKRNHIYSTVAGMIPHPAGKVGAAALRSAGYGRRHYRKGRRKRTGLMCGGAHPLNGRLYLI